MNHSVSPGWLFCKLTLCTCVYLQLHTTAVTVWYVGEYFMMWMSGFKISTNCDFASAIKWMRISPCWLFFDSSHVKLRGESPADWPRKDFQFHGLANNEGDTSRGVYLIILLCLLWKIRFSQHYHIEQYSTQPFVNGSIALLLVIWSVYCTLHFNHRAITRPRRAPLGSPGFSLLRGKAAADGSFKEVGDEDLTGRERTSNCDGFSLNGNYTRLCFISLSLRLTAAQGWAVCVLTRGREGGRGESHRALWIHPLVGTYNLCWLHNEQL